MKLAREINFGDRTANEDWTSKVSSMVENVHTAPSYSFSHFCEAKEQEKRKQYFSENFDLEEAFGPNNGCTEFFGTSGLP